MPDLLLELFSEEIPARMQQNAATDLRRMVTEALIQRGFMFEHAAAYATPRRLVLHVAGLPVKGRDVKEEKKGPRVGAPDAAVQGFLKSAGLASLDQAKIESDPKKGEFYVAVIEKPGQKTLDVLAEILPGIVHTFPWPKSMRWGAASAAPGSLRWVRPLHSIVATFGGEGEDPEIVPFDVGGVVAGNVTRGHRFMAPGEIRVKRFDDYVAALEAAKVVVDPERRKAIIREEARTLAFAQGLEVIEDQGLLDEVAGLVEWPVVLMGSFEEDFLEVPPEVIRATIRANQKCFVLKEAKTGKLAPRFLATANIEATDGGKTITAGNGRVIRARLSDARFFWETDKKVKLSDRLKKLDSVTFHAKLGSQGDRVKRIVTLAEALAPKVGAEPALAARAATLAKADLSTEMVGEFPELQGLMGRYYAALQGEPKEVATAIEDHYKPLGPSDRVPTDPFSVAVALADKLDILVGFWSIDEKPTGSKDPYALRRAALGVIRLVADNTVRLPLLDTIYAHFGVLSDQRRFAGGASTVSTELASPEDYLKAIQPLGTDLLAFFHDRLKVMLRDQGARHDLVDAVLSGAAAGAGSDDILLVMRRVEALGRFLETDDGKNLLAGFRRAANILRAEEKKDGAGAFEAPAEVKALVEPEELALEAQLGKADAAVGAAIAGEDYEGAMKVMASLRAPVDAFFEKVLVNAPEAALRLNRLRLLAQLRRVTQTVADFSRVGG